MAADKTITLKLKGPLRLVLREGEEVVLTVAVVGDDAVLRDPLVEKALAAMKRDPARPWTLDALAAAAGLSRAAFARRFRKAIGTSPLRHLAELRLQIAAERLAISDDTLAAIGAWIGYESEFAFARAFKRRLGIAPGSYRRTSRAGVVLARAA